MIYKAMAYRSARQGRCEHLGIAALGAAALRQVTVIKNNPNNPEMERVDSNVDPAYGQKSGRKEYMTKDKVEVNIKNVRNLEK